MLKSDKQRTSVQRLPANRGSRHTLLRTWHTSAPKTQVQGPIAVLRH